jgi:hypothetical protein
MKLSISRLGFTAIALVAGATVHAQESSTTGSILGTVVDQNRKAVPGARITVEGGRGQMVFVTDSAGLWRAPSLIPGRYTVAVTAAGFQSVGKQTVDVQLGQRSPMNIRLAAVSSAVVEVVATGSSMDSTAVTSGTTLNTEQFSTLPIGRSFTAIASLAPGVVDGGGTGAGNPSISGGSGLENQYVIDGANTTNSGYGGSGSFSMIYGSLGTGINSDFIQEVQVKSFGMDAEWGQSTGGIINAITKSGSNTFEGSAFMFLDPDGLQASDRYVYRTNGQEQPIWKASTRQELGVTVSGPIIKDKLFYFLGFNPAAESLKRTAPYRTDGTAYPLSGQTFENKATNNSYYGKLQWQMSTNQALELSVFGDPGKRDMGPQGVSTAFRGTEGRFTELEFGTQTATVKYNATFANAYFLEGRITSTENKLKTRLSALGDSEWQVRDTAQGGADVQPNGGGLYEKDLKGTNTQYEFKLTRTWENYDIKVGYLHEDVGWNSWQGRSGPSGFVDPHSGTAYTSGVRIQIRYGSIDGGPIVPYYRVERGNITSPRIVTKTKYDAVFLQTSLRFHKLNFKLGLRMEGQEMIGQDQTYKFKPSDNLAPRLGVTYDMNGDGKSKLYAFVGRYFEKVPNDICVRAFSNEAGVNRSDFRTLTGYNQLSNPILNGTPVLDEGATTPTTLHYRTTGDQTTLVIPGTKSMYQDELVLGFDNEFSNGLTLSNRLIYRKLGRILEDMSLDGNSYFIANPGSNNAAIAAATGFDGVATFPDPTRNYYAFEFEMRKATAKWNAFMNLRLSKLEGNYEGLFRNDNGQSDPNITSLYDLPVELLSDASRGLTGQEQYLIGALNTDRTLVINLGGSYNFDMGLTLGLSSRYLTGTPITSYLAHPVYENSGEVPVYGRGTEGRLPSRFLMDFSAQYNMKVGEKKRLTFIANVFNFFNQQKITNLDTNVDVGYGVANPNYMRPTSITGGNMAYDQGRRVRLGIKFSF